MTPHAGKKVTHHPLTRWRFEYGLTLAQMGRAMRCTQSYLSELEAGKKEPSPAFARNLSKFTNGEVKFSELITEKGLSK